MTLFLGEEFVLIEHFPAAEVAGTGGIVEEEGLGVLGEGGFEFCIKTWSGFGTLELGFGFKFLLRSGDFREGIDEGDHGIP